MCVFLCTDVRLIFIKVYSRKSRYIRKGESTAKTISSSTLEIYVATIVDLWSQQSMRGINSNPHPRAECIGLIEAAKNDEEKKRKIEYEDRGKLSFNDGYTSTDEMTKVIDFYFSEKIGNDLRNGLSFLLSHFLLLRGQSARMGELPDSQTVDL